MYRRSARESYKPLRRKVALKTAALKSMKSTASTSSQSDVFKTREFQANITDIALFLAKFLSGKSDIFITPQDYGGFACRLEKIGGRTYYNILVPKWAKYDLPLDPKSKYRIYRSSIWHEAMHSRYTPEKVYSIGARIDREQDIERVLDPLLHDVANIIEDRRIEDLGVKLWPGYKPERLFSNAYFWSQRMDVGEFYKLYLSSYYDPKTGTFPNITNARILDFLKQRLSHMRHEAFLQRLITGKIKGADKLPLEERQRIEDVAAYVEEELKEITKENVSDKKVYETIERLTKKVIQDLQLQYYKPPIRTVGQSSWDITFTPEWAEDVGTKDKQKVRAGIDDYFDEIVKVEYICTRCGKPYTKVYGHRFKGEKLTPPPGYEGLGEGENVV